MPLATSVMGKTVVGNRFVVGGGLGGRKLGERVVRESFEFRTIRAPGQNPKTGVTSNFFIRCGARGCGRAGRVWVHFFRIKRAPLSHSGGTHFVGVPSGLGRPSAATKSSRAERNRKNAACEYAVPLLSFFSASNGC